MYPVEKRFYDEFKNSMNLVYHPVIKVDNVRWFPDFIDTSTKVYYEVINSRQTFYEHYRKGHLDKTIRKGHKLILAVFLRELGVFALDEYKGDSRLWISRYVYGIKEGFYERNYGDGTKLF